MKLVKFVPALCKGDDAPFEGHIMLRMPTFDEKMEYLESLDMEVDAEGNVDRSGTKGKMKMIRAMVKNSEKHYQEILLKNKASGEELKVYDNLSTDPEAHPILVEVAGFILQGLKVGNA